MVKTFLSEKTEKSAKVLQEEMHNRGKVKIGFDDTSENVENFDDGLTQVVNEEDMEKIVKLPKKFKQPKKILEKKKEEKIIEKKESKAFAETLLAEIGDDEEDYGDEEEDEDNEEIWEQNKLQEPQSSNVENIAINVFEYFNSKRCPSCNNKIKKSKVMRKDNILIQVFTCKNKFCNFRKEITLEV